MILNDNVTRELKWRYWVSLADTR